MLRANFGRVAAGLLLSGMLVLGNWPSNADPVGVGDVDGYVRRGPALQPEWLVYAVKFDAGGLPTVAAVDHTDAAGYYRLVSVPAGDWSVWATNATEAYCMIKSPTVTVVPGTTLQVDLTGAATRRIRGSISPGLADKAVWLCDSAGSVRLALSDANGQFDIEGSELGAKLVVVAHASSYSNAVIDVSAGAGDADLGVLGLTSGAGAVQGYITYPASSNPTEPAEGVTVGAFRQVNGQELLFGTATTNALGAYVVPRLPDGDYTLRTTDTHYAEGEWPVDVGLITFDPSVQIRGFSGVAFTVAGGQVALLDRALTWSAGLTVSLLSSGAPLSAAAVILERPGYATTALMQRVGVVDDQDVPENVFMTVMPATPGTWVVRVAREGLADHTQTVLLAAGARASLSIDVGGS